MEEMDPVLENILTDMTEQLRNHTKLFPSNLPNPKEKEWDGFDLTEINNAYMQTLNMARSRVESFLDAYDPKNDQYVYGCKCLLEIEDALKYFPDQNGGNFLKQYDENIEHLEWLMEEETIFHRVKELSGYSRDLSVGKSEITKHCENDDLGNIDHSTPTHNYAQSKLIASSETQR